MALCFGLASCAGNQTARGVQPTAPAARTILVEVVGDRVSVEGKEIGGDPKAIGTALRRSGYYAFVVRGDAQVDDATLGRVLEAAQSSKPSLRLELGELRMEVDMGVRRPTTNHIVATLESQEAKLWRVDGGAFEELGSWQLSDVASEAATRSKLQRSCAEATCEAWLNIGRHRAPAS